MLLKYLFKNKLLTKFRTNLCDRCLSRLESTDIPDKPIKNLRKRRPKDTYYLCIDDKSIAKMVANYVTSDLPDDSVIFESCPGNGVLTNQLLKSRVQSVRVFEENMNFLKNLKKLENKYPNRLQTIDKQILNYRKFFTTHLNEFEYEVEYWFRNIEVREWRSVPALRFVAVLSPKSTLFLRFIIKLLLRKDMFFSYGRTEFFVFVSEPEYRYMTAKPETNYNNYRSTTVLYSTLFNIRVLETLSYSKFQVYTKTNENLSKKELKQANLKGNAKLVQLTPKVYLDEFSAQTLQDYYFFVNQTFMKRKNYVIPFLENWFPNCGPDLIRKGIPVFKYFGDLKPEEVLELFKYFHNRSDYQNSVYKMFAMREDFESVDDSIKEEDVEDHEEDNYLKDKIEINEKTTDESII